MKAMTIISLEIAAIITPKKNIDLKMLAELNKNWIALWWKVASTYLKYRLIKNW